MKVRILNTRGDELQMAFFGAGDVLSMKVKSVEVRHTRWRREAYIELTLVYLPNGR